ncbi:hypothetical protein D9M68_503160 [compost metagenome]
MPKLHCDSETGASRWFRQLLTVDNHSTHQIMANRLAQTSQPTIMISGHGMYSRGRIVNYLKAMLGDAQA